MFTCMYERQHVCLDVCMFTYGRKELMSTYIMHICMCVGICMHIYIKRENECVEVCMHICHEHGDQKLMLEIQESFFVVVFVFLRHGLSIRSRSSTCQVQLAIFLQGCQLLLPRLELWVDSHSKHLLGYWGSELLFSSMLKKQML